jgi:hypothetical protein
MRGQLKSGSYLARFSLTTQGSLMILALLLPLAGCSAKGRQGLAGKSETGLYLRAPSGIAAQSFILVDSSGRPLAELSSAPQGGAGLVLLDLTGKARAALVTTATGEPGLKLYDATGSVRTAAVVSSDNTAGIALYDTAGRSRAALTETPSGDCHLMLFDATGRQIEVLPESSRASR